MNRFNLSTHSIQAAVHRGRIERILAATLAAVDPQEAVARHLQRDGEQLRAGGRAYALERFRRILVVGAGKAGAPMAQAAVQILGERLDGGLVITKQGHAGGVEQVGPVQLAEARHPLPDERGVQATRRLIELVSETTPDDLVICLISGGGSALLLSPVPGVSLADLQSLTAALLACGANINEINSLRKHLDQVKGGGLARLAAPAQLVTLILSDVVGDPLDVIASGPTVPDPTSFAEAYGVLERYAILEQVPPAVRAHLERGRRGELPDTPKQGDALFDQVQHVVVGSNLLAAQAALAQAQAEGLNTLLLTTYLQGEARQAGRMLAAIGRELEASGNPLRRPACVIAGGETTVTLAGKGGLGGRNQELALGAVQELAGLPDVTLVALATDGGDGPTDAAGAVATGATLERARQAGLGPADFLARNDAYHFFEALGDLLKPGPTQTNVNDLAFLFAF